MRILPSLVLRSKLVMACSTSLLRIPGTPKTPSPMIAVVREHISNNEEIVLSSDEEDNDSLPDRLGSDDESNISSAYSDSDSESDSYIDRETVSCEDSELVLGAQQVIGKGDPAEKGSSKASVSDALVWHRWLGHAGTTSHICAMMEEGILPVVKVEETKCDPCVKGKFKRSYRGCLTNANFPGICVQALLGKYGRSRKNGTSTSCLSLMGTVVTLMFLRCAQRLKLLRCYRIR